MGFFLCFSVVCGIEYCVDALTLKTIWRIYENSIDLMLTLDGYIFISLRKVKQQYLYNQLL